MVLEAGMSHFSVQQWQDLTRICFSPCPPVISVTQRHLGMSFMEVCVYLLAVFPWRRVWPPTPAFLPGRLHGQRSLAGCSPRGREGPGTDSAAAHIVAFGCSCFLVPTHASERVPGKSVLKLKRYSIFS